MNYRKTQEILSLVTSGAWQDGTRNSEYIIKTYWKKSLCRMFIVCDKETDKIVDMVHFVDDKIYTYGVTPINDIVSFAISLMPKIAEYESVTAENIKLEGIDGDNGE